MSANMSNYTTNSPATDSPDNGYDVIPDSIIPAIKELTAHDHWATYKNQPDPSNGKMKKVPQVVSGKFKASSTGPSTWSSFEAVVAELKSGADWISGFVFALTEEAGYTLLDLDSCRNPETGEIEPWAQAIIDRMNSYSEVSPSGTGVHIWAKARKPGSRCSDSHGLELYDHRRFATVTGRHLAGTPTTIEERQAETDALYAEKFGNPAEGGDRNEPGWFANAFPQPIKAGDGRRAPDGLPKYVGYFAQQGLPAADTMAILTVWDQANATAHGDQPLGSEEIESLVVGMYRRYGFNPQGKFANSQGALRWAPAFPIESFRGVARQFIEAAARSVGVPVEMIALPVLAVVGGAAGRNVVVKLKADFTQSAHLWIAIVAPPGTGKTPAFQQIERPLRVLQDAAFETYKADLDAWTAAGANGPKPVLESYLSTDATIEATYKIFERSPGVVMMLDELVGFVKRMDAYRGGHGGDRQAYLSIWAGTMVKIDRKSQPPIYISRASASIVGGIQNDSLGELADHLGREDGFLDRYLWALPDVHPSRWTEETVDAALVGRMANLLLKIRTGEDPEPSTREITFQPLDPDDPKFANSQGALQVAPSPADRAVHLAPEAKERWIEWFNQNTEHVAQAHGTMAGVLSKMPIQLARIALVLHLLDDPTVTEPLSLDTLERAIALTDWSWGQAARVLALIGRYQTRELSNRVLDALADHGGWMSRTQLWSAISRHASATDLNQAFETLLQTGRVESQTDHNTGGKPAELWRVIKTGS